MDLTYLNDFFDKIYVITLKRSVDRHEHVSQLLQKIDYSFFWGVDGQDLQLSNLIEENIFSKKETEKHSYKSMLTKNEIGCAWSHIKVYEDIIKNNYKNALIFEDDLAINNEFDGRIDRYLSDLPEDWELVYLGHNDEKSSVPISVLLRIYVAYPIFNLLTSANRFDRKKLRNHYQRNYSQNLVKAGHHWGLHAYGVTNHCAKKLVQLLYPIRMEADNAIGKFCTEGKLNAFCFKEKLFVQNRDLKSVIGKRHDLQK